jgi:hypothetical protein
MAEIGITLEVASTRLQEYLDAERDVLRNQSYTMADGRSLTRADLSEIRQGITFWNQQVQSLNPSPRARGRARRGVVMG